MLKIFSIYFLIVSFIYLSQIQALKKMPENKKENISVINSNKKHSPFSQFLPDPLSSIKVGQTSKKNLIQIAGHPLKVDDNQNHFYSLSGRNYDSTIGITNSKVSYILYSPPAGSLLLKKLKPYIAQKSIDQAYQQKIKTGSSHSSGRTFDVVLPAQSIRITVNNNTQESIQSLLFLK